MTNLVLLQPTTLERLAKSQDFKLLSGKQGVNRVNGIPCQIEASNDYDAVCAWLREYKQKTTTYTLYRKEAERLLLWCLIVQQKPMSSLNRNDLVRYEQFLQDPSPKALWCAPKGAKRGSPNWRPFVGPLSPSAINTTMAALNSLFDYLVKADYLSRNPLSLRRAHSSTRPTHSERVFQVTARILDDEQWQALLTTLESMPETTHKEQFYKHRLRLMVHMLFFLGLRVGELADLTWQSFRSVNDQWWLYLIGKGNKPGKIPVHNKLLETMADYRVFRQVSPFPEPDDMRPIIVNWHHRAAMTPRGMNGLLKALALEASEKFIGEPAKADKLKKFSAHWLRHLSASMQDRAGVKFGHIRDNLRHENDETTRIYVHAEDNERFDSMQKLIIGMSHQDVS